MDTPDTPILADGIDCMFVPLVCSLKVRCYHAEEGGLDYEDKTIKEWLQWCSQPWEKEALHEIARLHPLIYHNWRDMHALFHHPQWYWVVFPTEFIEEAVRHMRLIPTEEAYPVIDPDLATTSIAFDSSYVHEGYPVAFYESGRMGTPVLVQCGVQGMLVVAPRTESKEDDE